MITTLYCALAIWLTVAAVIWFRLPIIRGFARQWVARGGPARWIHLNGSLYLERYILRGGPEQDGSRINIYLHRFHQPDDDRGVHNHPHVWNASLILTGGYVERRLVVRRDGMECYQDRILTAPSLNRIPNERTFHQIVALLPGETWTLFISGPKHWGGWGFLIDGLFQRKNDACGCKGCPAGSIKCSS